MACRILDESSNLFRVRLVNRMAGALHFDGMAVGTLGIHPLQIRIDDAIRLGNCVPAGLGLPRGLRGRRREHCCCRERLRVGLEFRLLFRQVRGVNWRRPRLGKGTERYGAFPARSWIDPYQKYSMYSGSVRRCPESLAPTDRRRPIVQAANRSEHRLPECRNSRDEY